MGKRQKLREQEPGSPSAQRKPRAPIRFLGVLVAALGNLVVMTAISLGGSALSGNVLLALILFGAALVGAATAIYVGARGGIHAFLGGMISIVPIATIAFARNWALAIYAGGFCAIGGLLAERLSRRR